MTFYLKSGVSDSQYYSLNPRVIRDARLILMFLEKRLKFWIINYFYLNLFKCTWSQVVILSMPFLYILSFCLWTFLTFIYYGWLLFSLHSISFGVSASHLLTASVMSAPAALAYAKLFYPETKKSKTTFDHVVVPKSKIIKFVLKF